MKSPIRILAVDGGGVGGIIPAKIIERLSQNSDFIKNVDLVAGTSTGGLIALGLALGKSPAELSNLYLENAKDIFSRANRRYMLLRGIYAKYNPRGLRSVLEKIAGGKKVSDLHAKKLMVPVTAIERSDKKHRPAGIFISTAYQILNNSNEEKYWSSHWDCVDLGLATSAAPSFFPSHEVNLNGESWNCWDGGVVANNPAMAAAGEILRLHLAEQSNQEAREDYNFMPDIRLLSIGTGLRQIDIPNGDRGVFRTVRPLISGLLDTAVGSAAFLMRQFLGKKSIRVNMPLNNDYSLDDADAVPGLARDTESYMAKLDGLEFGQPDGTKVKLEEWLDQYWYN